MATKTNKATRIDGGYNYRGIRIERHTFATFNRFEGGRSTGNTKNLFFIIHPDVFTGFGDDFDSDMGDTLSECKNAIDDMIERNPQAVEEAAAKALASFLTDTAKARYAVGSKS